MSIANWLSSLLQAHCYSRAGAFRFNFDVAHCHSFHLAITVMIIFLVLVPDSRNIFAAVPTAKVSAWKTVELVPRW